VLPGDDEGRALCIANEPRRDVVGERDRAKLHKVGLRRPVITVEHRAVDAAAQLVARGEAGAAPSLELLLNRIARLPHVAQGILVTDEVRQVPTALIIEDGIE